MTRLPARLALGALLGILAAPLRAGPDPDPLPEPARVALRRGLMAVEVEEWALAADAFAEAIGNAPGVPALLHDYGLACDRAGGRDLLALASFRIYLQGEPPPSPEATLRVCERMRQLRARAERDIAVLFATALETAEDIPDEGRELALARIAEDRAWAGDGDGAREVAARVPLLMPLRRDTLACIERILKVREGVPTFGSRCREVRAPGVGEVDASSKVGGEVAQGDPVARFRGGDGAEAVPIPAPQAGIVVESLLGPGRGVPMEAGTILMRISRPLDPGVWQGLLEDLRDSEALADLPARLEAIRKEKDPCVVSVGLADAARDMAVALSLLRRFEP